MDNDQIAKYIEEIPNEVLAKISFAMPWQYSSIDEDIESRDSDGFDIGRKRSDQYSREILQNACWDKFHQNPHVNTAIRRRIGRLTGYGYECSCGIWTIQEAIEEIELDPRNRLYSFWPKYIGRYKIEGELILCFTCHPDGFIEIDFIDPSTLKGGDEDTGILYHPTKKTFPLFFCIEGEGTNQQIPSINIARYPELLREVAKNTHFNPDVQNGAKNQKNIFKQFGGFYQFILYWDDGFITRRAVSHLRTVLQWLNHYENLKKYEIDHKKSSGAYVWVIKMTDPKAFKIWLTLSDADKKKTGIMSKKTPGGTLILPPGMDMTAVNPNLTAIKDQDTDILHMVGGGLDEPEDIMTGNSGGTFASVKASRGPMSDTVSDDIAYFSRYLRYDFWGSIFFLKSKISDFPDSFKIKKAVDFDEKAEPIFKKIKRRPEQLIEFSFPVSETIDLEARSRALLGVKHGPIAQTLGIPNADVAQKLGFGGYGRARLEKATEDEMYPALVYAADAESLQEIEEGETPKKKKVDKASNKEVKKPIKKE